MYSNSWNKSLSIENVFLCFKLLQCGEEILRKEDRGNSSGANGCIFMGFLMHDSPTWAVLTWNPMTSCNIRYPSSCHLSDVIVTPYTKIWRNPGTQEECSFLLTDQAQSLPLHDKCHLDLGSTIKYKWIRFRQAPR